MATNSRTWFYTEPEHRPYLIEERVNHTLWANRFGSIYMNCVRAEPPFKMEGVWSDILITFEWMPNAWFKMTANREDSTLVTGMSQVLQLVPTVSYQDESGQFIVEWWRADGDKRYEEIKGRPAYIGIKTYRR